MTNVYIGEKTELWMDADVALDQEAVAATLKEVGFELEGLSKAAESMY